MQSFALISTLVLGSFGCSTPQEREHFPDRQVDRPYSLPKGLNTWKVIFTGTLSGTLDQTSRKFGTFPFNWEQGLTDSLTLIWAPLPLEIRYQFFQNLESFFGFTFIGIGPTYSRGFDLNWSPTLHLTYRRKLVQDIALEGTLLLEPEVNSADPLGNRTLGMQFAVWYQLWNRAALALKPHILYETGAPRSRYFDLLPPGRNGNRWIFPIFVDFQAVLSRQWQTDLEYQWISLPPCQGYFAHQILGSVSLYF